MRNISTNIVHLGICQFLDRNLIMLKMSEILLCKPEMDHIFQTSCKRGIAWDSFCIQFHYIYLKIFALFLIILFT